MFRQLTIGGLVCVVPSLCLVAPPTRADARKGVERALERQRVVGRLALGGFHTCALDTDGVKCWGLNGDGQTSVPTLRAPTFMTAGDAHTCALDAEDLLWDEDGPGEHIEHAAGDGDDLVERLLVVEENGGTIRVDVGMK